ncbi:Dipeptidyl-peptidase 5 [bacterium HR36]|nr:Dipeptidyl-peptidase 5 [bacterium HR36]
MSSNLYCPDLRARLDPAPLFWLTGVLGGLVALVGTVSFARSDQAYPTSWQRLTEDGDYKAHLAWSPDGSRIVFTRIHEGKMSLWLLHIASRQLTRLTSRDTGPDFDPAWFPDGKRLAYVYDQLQGTDGKLFIYTLDSDGSNPTVLIPNKAFEECPRVSPNGQHLLFVSTRDGNQEIYLADVTGKNIRRLSNHPAPDTHPCWSPDGKRIAFASARSGNWDIWVMNADGSETRRLTDHPALDCWPVWAPDGRRLAFTSNRDGNYEIYLIRPDGTALHNVSHSPAWEHFATWSPDSRRLAFVSTCSGGYDIYVVDCP